VPQVAPAGSQACGVHTGVPVAHSMVAVDAQGSSAAQSAPWLHAVQIPALQTWFGPQVVPFGTGVAVSTQTGVPVVQVVVPVTHGLRGVQAAPSEQGRHWARALQTRPVPQEVPAGSGAPSTHTGEPDAQSMVPAGAQGLAVEHEAPCVQASQAPAAEQTSPAPQAVPGGWLVWSVQTAAPLEHS